MIERVYVWWINTAILKLFYNPWQYFSMTFHYLCVSLTSPVYWSNKSICCIHFFYHPKNLFVRFDDYGNKILFRSHEKGWKLVVHVYKRELHRKWKNYKGDVATFPARIPETRHSATGHEPATYISQTLILPIINSTQKMRPYISPPDMLCGPEISYYNFYNRPCLIISFPLQNNTHEFFPSLIKFFEYLLDYGKHEWKRDFSGKFNWFFCFFFCVRKFISFFCNQFGWKVFLWTDNLLNFRNYIVRNNIFSFPIVVIFDKIRVPTLP